VGKNQDFKTKNPQEAIQILKIFNENAEKLRNSKFIKWCAVNPIRVHMPINPVIEKKNSFPEEDDINAFILTFRKFLQNNDISIANISQIYSNFPLSNTLKDAFETSRVNLNDYLDSPPIFRNVGAKGLEKMTSRKLIEIYIYGFMAHNNPEKYAKYRLIDQNEFSRDFQWMAFNSIIHEVFVAILHIAYLNEKAILELEGSIK
jgi:hypothetical protein